MTRWWYYTTLLTRRMKCITNYNLLKATHSLVYHAEPPQKFNKKNWKTRPQCGSTKSHRGRHNQTVISTKKLKLTDSLQYETDYIEEWTYNKHSLDMTPTWRSGAIDATLCILQSVCLYNNNNNNNNNDVNDNVFEMNLYEWSFIAKQPAAVTHLTHKHVSFTHQLIHMVSLWQTAWAMLMKITKSNTVESWLSGLSCSSAVTTCRATVWKQHHPQNCKYTNFHKPPDEDWDMATATHKKIDEDKRDKQTHRETNRHTHHNTLHHRVKYSI